MNWTAKDPDFAEERAALIAWLEDKAGFAVMDKAGMAHLLDPENWFCKELQQRALWQSITFVNNGTEAEMQRNYVDGAACGPWDITLTIAAKPKFEFPTMSGAGHFPSSRYPSSAPKAEPSPPASVTDPNWGTWS